MKLIEYSNYQIKVADEAFLVKPIRTLFNKDKSKTKDNFWSQMSYMYFLVDPRSSYMYIVDEEERAKEIIKQEGLPEDFTPSKELLEAMDIYKKTTQTSSSLLLEDTRLAIDKLRQFLKDVDLNKNTYVNLLGLSGAKEELNQVLQKCEQDLTSLGELQPEMDLMILEGFLTYLK